MTLSTKNVERLLDDLAKLDGDPGPAESIDSASCEALVRGALQRVSIAGGQRGARGGSVAKRRLRRGVLVGIGVLAATSAAAALGAGIGRQWLARWTPPAHHDTGITSRAPSGRSGERLAKPAVQPPSPDLEIAPPSPDRRQTVVRRRPRVPVVSPAEPSELAPSSQAVDLLQRANSYRRQRQYGQALKTYLDVAERYPDSRQAEAARVAAAALRLEHFDDAKGATSAYRAAASAQGQLGEEAAYGLAEARRAEGRPDLEREQLERFIADYPRSPLTATARQRLEELGR